MSRTTHAADPFRRQVMRDVGPCEASNPARYGFRNSGVDEEDSDQASGTWSHCEDITGLANRGGLRGSLLCGYSMERLATADVHCQAAHGIGKKETNLK